MTGDRPRLSPLTRLVLLGALVTQTVIGLVALVAPGLVHSLTWPAPFEPVPDLWLRYDGALYLAMAVGAGWAIFRDDPSAARTFLVIAVPYVAASVLITLLAAFAQPGVPPIAWLYVVLGVIFVVLGTIAWRREGSPLDESDGEVSDAAP